MSTPHRSAGGGSNRSIPALLAGLIDDAAVFPPGNAALPDAIREHLVHRAAWYAPLVGPLLLPASALPRIAAVLDATLPDGDSLAIGVIGDTGPAALPAVLDALDPRLDLRQVEIAVAKRGEDPQPGLGRLIGILTDRPGLSGFAEIPLTFGFSAALDTLVDARASGVPVAAKFRTGGLAAELFPTPIELAAVIGAGRERNLPFKLTAGLHHAIRHTDPETRFVHHGFLNVLAATLRAVREDAEAADVAEVLAATDPIPLVETVRRRLDADRPLWIGFGTCSIEEPIEDLVRLGLLPGREMGEAA